jgi:AcrR family transcriptional regulator
MSERSLMVEATDTKSTLRRRIIEAADTLIREQGLSGATTREIARAAGCAEGSIYVHFEDKIDLVIAVVVEREPTFAELLELPGKAGARTLEENLVPWAEELLRLLRDNQPVFFALMGDRNVFDRFKARVRERQTGLIAVFQAVVDYVAAEQGLGRIDSRIRPDVVASTMIGACRDRAFTRMLAPAGPTGPEDFARELVDTVVFGLASAEARRPPIPNDQAERS